MDMRQNGRLALLFVVLAVSYAAAQRIEKPQPARAIAGVVTDSTGAAIEGVVVEERWTDGITVLRATNTDARGMFKLSSKSGKKLYNLQFRYRRLYWMRLTVRLDKHGEESLAVRLPIEASTATLGPS
jgi:hypothetical protein